MSDELARMLLDNGAIKYGDFVLPFGNRTTYFVDVKEVSTDPKFLETAATELSKEVKEKTIAGIELGAVPLLVATSIKLQIQYIIVRKKHEHGTKELLIGKLEKGTKVDIIDDVVSTGGSILLTAKLLRERGAEVSRAIAVVDREEGGAALLKDNGIKLVSLIKGVSELKKHYDEG
ncbi:MAG: orotate phosphoribosyltransferase [Candidatus Micrarchaeaceae archaeon]